MAPVFRGKGLERAFFLFLDRKYSSAVKRMRLETESDNKRAEARYRGLGFDMLGYRQFYKES